MSTLLRNSNLRRLQLSTSALKGDNITERSHTLVPGGHAFGILETVNPRLTRLNQPLRFPVQWVNRPNLDFRGFSGTVESGTVEVDQSIRFYRLVN